MGYEKTEVRILRIKHKIIFRPGTQAIDMKEMLKAVPDEATIGEVSDGSVSFWDEGNKPMAYIEFQEEKEEKYTN